MNYLVANTIKSGNKTIATAGTPLALLTSDAKAVWVIVQAVSTNTGDVWVGGSDVLASTKTGIRLTAGSSTPMLPITNVAKIYADVATNGDKVSFIYGVY